MSHENLNKEEAKQKLKHLVLDIRIAMMVTGIEKEEFSAIPMSTKEIDGNGDIWFLSFKDSQHNANIAQSPKIQLLYSNPLEMEFLSISGTGTLIEDENILKKLLENKKEPWLKKAANSQLAAIKFTPSGAHYWDSHLNKYKELYRLGIAALNRDEKNLDQEGKLKF